MLIKVHVILFQNTCFVNIFNSSGDTTEHEAVQAKQVSI